MRKTKLPLAGTILVMAVLTITPSAPADILNDILDIATAARDRATEARNNAANARDRATEARNNAATARDNAAAARDTAVTARDTAIEMRDNMRAGVEALSSNVQAAIDEAIEDLQQDVADELDGRDAFVQGGSGEAFRQQLIALLENSEALLNALNTAAGMPEARADFGREAALINAVPVRLLYPLYRALVAEAPGVLASFNELLHRAAADVQIVAALLLNSTGPIEGDLLDNELHACAYALDNLVELRRAASDLTKFAIGARVVGALLKAAGTTELHKSAAVWGWVGLSIKNSRVKKLGELIDGAGGVVNSLSGYVSAKTSYCAAIGIEGEARDRDREILANQRTILRYLRLQTTGTQP